MATAKNAGEVASNFVQGYRCASGNHSSVQINPDQYVYTLHGSVIATLNTDNVKTLDLTMAGYDTTTTRKALANIVRAFAESVGVKYVYKDRAILMPDGRQLDLSPPHTVRLTPKYDRLKPQDHPAGNAPSLSVGK